MVEMKNKYYIPSIEEFHVGFEYESNYLESENIWKKKVLSQEESGYFFESYIADASPLEFRVKYLDREDIESLGFEFESKGEDNILFFDTVKYDRGLKIKVKDNDRWKIRLESDSNRVWITQGRDWTRFLGIIKNKSELKRILKQLNINNET